MLLVAIAGLLWGLNGIVFSYIARKSMKFASVIGVQAAWGVILSWILISNFKLLMTREIPQIALLSVVLIGSGILCAAGMMIMQRALKIGHHGIVFTISQSAMIIPFLFGVIVLGERVDYLKWIGLFFVIFSFITFGSEQSTRTGTEGCKKSYIWFILALLVFL